MNKRFLVTKTLIEQEAFNYLVELKILNISSRPCINTFCTEKMNYERGKTRKGVNGRLRCSKKDCKKSISVTKGTILENSHIS